MATSSHQADRKADLVLHFADRVLLAFSYFFFTIEFKKELHFPPSHPTRRTLWILPTIRAACLGTTLMVIRDVDNFLTPRTEDSRPDDVKASDLGLKEDLSFLARSERRRINKLIIHSTTVAAYEKQDVPWDIGELTLKCAYQGLHFLKWVQTNLTSKEYPRVWAAAGFYSMQLEAILKYAEKNTDSKMESV
jgi:hypothetical protein